MNYFREIDSIGRIDSQQPPREQMAGMISLLSRHSRQGVMWRRPLLSFGHGGLCGWIAKPMSIRVGEASPPDKSPDLVSVSSDFIGADHLLKTSLPESVSNHGLSEFLPPKP